ncbi:MAG: hypothetical protein ABEJ00_00605 [Gemmatimonadota bacterium]
MSSDRRTPLEIAVGELTRREPDPGAGRAPEAAPSADGRKRMFMSGRVGPDSSRVHYGEPARAPVDGPWELALVVRPR